MKQTMKALASVVMGIVGIAAAADDFWLYEPARKRLSKDGAVIGATTVSDADRTMQLSTTQQTGTTKVYPADGVLDFSYPIKDADGNETAQNIGDVLSPLPDLEECYIVLAKPKAGVSTGKAFGEFDRHGVRHLDTCSMLYFAANGDFDGICSKAGNVFEQLIEVPQRVPIKSVMYDNNAVCACMSGSGPTCYGIFKNKEDAEKAYETLKKDYKETYLCVPVNSGLTKVQAE